MTDQALTVLVPQIGVAAACRALGRSRATHHRRHRKSPPPPRPAPVRHIDRVQPRALSPVERARILEVLHSERFADAAPAQVWATLLDEGVYLASESSFYRILRGAHGGVPERRRQAVHPARVRPELLASAPNQVWSWDIERHEAPGTEWRWKTATAALSQQGGEAGGSPIREMPGRADSSPDNDGTHQYYRMVRVRQARREGAREEPVV